MTLTSPSSGGASGGGGVLAVAEAPPRITGRPDGGWPGLLRLYAEQATAAP